MTRTGLTLVGLMLGTGLGCGGPLGPEAERVPSTDPNEPAFARKESALRGTGDDTGIIIGNGLSTQSLLVNALTGNPKRVEKLIANSLNDSFADPFTAQSLSDPAVKELLMELAGCALRPDQSLRAGSYIFGGSAGMCPDWLTSPPTEACLEVVSSCLLARNNAFGYHVPISMRGEPAGLDQLHFTGGPTVPPRPWPGDLTVVKSLYACSAASYTASKDCGWHPIEIDTCVPGTTVIAGLGGRDPNHCGNPTTYGSEVNGSDMVLRVCSGQYACNHAASLAESNGSCGTIFSAVNFTCPASGYYSVMAAPWSIYDGAVTTGVTSHFTEMQAFPFREGAFYGNIFDPVHLNIGVDVDPVTGAQVIYSKPVTDPTGAAIIYQNMYSCSDDDWATPEAYETHRICTIDPVGAPTCAATRLGSCKTYCTSSDGSFELGDNDFEGCSDAAGVSWTRPLTTFIENSCSLFQQAGWSYCQK